MDDVTEKQSSSPANMGRRSFFRKVSEPFQKAYEAAADPSPHESSLERYLREKKIERRNFLVKGGLLGTFLLWGGALLHLSRNQKEEPATPTSAPTPTPDAVLTTAPAITPNLDPQPDYEEANNILNLMPQSPERINLEIIHVQKAQTLEQINLALHVVNDPFLRAALVEKIAVLRKEGRYGLRQAIQEEKDFAIKNNVDLETVIFCTDSYFEAKSMLENKLQEMIQISIAEGRTEKEGRAAFFKLFRPDLLQEVRNGNLPQEVIDNLEIEDILPNPGVLIGLVLAETGRKFNENEIPKNWPKDLKIKTGVFYGAVNIGNKRALDAINGKDAENAKAALIELYADLSKDGKLKYNAEKIFASDKNGDIGSAQFRPNTALTFHQFLKKNFDFSLHPASLKAITAACLYLSWGYTWWEDKEKTTKIKYGFIKEKLRHMPIGEAILNKLKAIHKAGFDKWNSDLVKGFSDWETTYQRDIIDKGYFPPIAQRYSKSA